MFGSFGLSRTAWVNASMAPRQIALDLRQPRNADAEHAAPDERARERGLVFAPRVRDTVLLLRRVVRAQNVRAESPRSSSRLRDPPV